MLYIIMYFAVKSDLACREIPDECSLAICILAVGCGGFSLDRVVFSLGLMTIMAFISGFGDAKLFGALALLFGKKAIIIAALSFCLAGAFTTTAVILSKITGTNRLKLSDSIPFAPFIAVPALAVYTNELISYFLLIKQGF